MRTRLPLLVLLMLIHSAAVHAQETPRSTPKQQFLALNGDYYERVTEFYATMYLPGAVRSMTAAIASPAFRDRDAERVLRALIAEFLRAYIEGGGQISRAESERVVARLDRRVQAMVRDQRVFERHLKWRHYSAVNRLGFLMGFPFPLHLVVPDNLAELGWEMKTLDTAKELRKYAGYFEVAPDLALEFENGGLARAGKQPWLTLLAFPSMRVGHHTAKPGPHRARPGWDLPPMELFGSTYNHLIFAAQGDFPAEQERLAAELRDQIAATWRPFLRRRPSKD